ncbi:MAG: cytochrome c biogenesis protein CcdA [Pseudomonadota bacterium]
MFGIDVIDAPLMTALILALFGGLLSFLSPCVLPIVPPYLAYMAGTTIAPDGTTSAGRGKVVASAGSFVLGLSTVFLMLGFAASEFGRLILAYQREMAILGGAIIAIFGLHFLGLLRIPLLMRDARFDAGDRGGSVFGAYVLGLAFAFGWTPCIGPILAGILALAGSTGTVEKGMIMMGVYALGLGLPFLISALFLDRIMPLFSRLKAQMHLVERTMGAFLVLIGAMLISGLFTEMSFWLLDTFPGLALLG